MFARCASREKTQADDELLAATIPKGQRVLHEAPSSSAKMPLSIANFVYIGFQHWRKQLRLRFAFMLACPMAQHTCHEEGAENRGRGWVVHF